MGSSMRSTREPQDTARPTAMAWRWPPESLPASEFTEPMRMWVRSRSVSASRIIARRSSQPM